MSGTFLVFTLTLFLALSQVGPTFAQPNTANAQATPPRAAAALIALKPLPRMCTEQRLDHIPQAHRPDLREVIKSKQANPAEFAFSHHPFR